MQISQVPALLQKAWAVSGTKNVIPVASQIAVTPGAASLTDGFPPLTMTPLAAGGVPPYGADTNGILNWLSQICQWANAGGMYLYDGTFSAAIGGYPKGATLLKANGTGIWISTVDNNATDPDTGGAGWATIAVQSPVPAMTFAQVSALTSDQGPIYVSDHHSMAYFSASAYYNGYRNDKCGDWHIGSMSPSRPGEIDGIGGIYNIADFPSLWGWAQERGFVVPAANWVPSATNYSLIGTTQFRVPDYRNMFPRVSGTDADTANAAPVGTYKADALQNITGTFGNVWFAGSSGAFGYDTTSSAYIATVSAGTNPRNTFDASRVVRTSSETRPVSSRVAPVILV